MSQAEKWAMHLAAAQQCFEREGHLKVPRKHVETISLPRPGDGRDEERLLKLGAWVANQRSRAAPLTADRVDQLSAVGERCRHRPRALALGYTLGGLRPCLRRDT
ncbi:helicase associated domain-containing protein [Streptomyces atroolivaceus]|uniref:helicase associated domain-containing protein n=1 Tax=Streptomyces atroolivaceus TaxID=66869 RepID=UPI0036AC2DDE